MKTVTFGKQPMEIGPLTAGQLAAIAPLVVRLKPHFGPEGVDLGVLVSEAPALVAAAAALLGRPEAEVARLPLAEFVDLVGELLFAVVAANRVYLEETLAPAVARLSRRVSELTAVLGAPATPGPSRAPAGG